MSDDYGLSRFKRRALYVFAILFALTAFHRVVTLPLPLVAPQFMAWEAGCSDAGCTVEAVPIELLPPEPRARVFGDAAASARYDARLNDPAVRVKLFALEVIGRAPLVALFLSVALVLWRTARRGAGAGLDALPWISRAAVAAVALAIVTPVAEALRTVLLLITVLPDEAIWLDLDLDQIKHNLMLAAAAWAATWVVGAGIRARAELSSFV